MRHLTTGRSALFALAGAPTAIANIIRGDIVAYAVRIVVQRFSDGRTEFERRTL